MRLTAHFAGQGMYRIPAFTLCGVEVPMCTIMDFGSYIGWTSNLDGTMVSSDATASTPHASAIKRIKQHFAQHGIDDANIFSITFTSPYTRTFRSN